MTERALPSATGLLRTKTPSSIPFLVNLWASILVSLGSLSKVFADIGNHANFSSLASIILDAFAASTLHRYLTCISKFLTWCRESDLPLPSISAATVLDVLQGGSRNSGMKGSTVLKSLQWCRKQADVQAWSFLDSPLIQGWMKSKVPADRRESLPLPLYVVVQWERRLLQANIPLREIIIIGGFLLMIWTGLRFADLQRVTITSVVCSASEIRGDQLAYQDLLQGSAVGSSSIWFLISWQCNMVEQICLCLGCSISSTVRRRLGLCDPTISGRFCGTTLSADVISFSFALVSSFSDHSMEK